LKKHHQAIFDSCFQFLSEPNLVMEGFINQRTGDPEILRGHTVGILMGIASGAAMLPYTVIKEANSPELGGTATGCSFLSEDDVLISTTWSLMLALAHYQAGFRPLLYGIIVALILTFFCGTPDRRPGRHESEFSIPSDS